MKLLSLMRSVSPGAARGALVSIRELRQAAEASGVTVKSLDTAILHNARWGNVSLHASDLPVDHAGECLVVDGVAVIGVAIRQI